ncbi:DUF6177 family protein [Compostimonas suwonensis]|uniref:Uncharacterized protein n=1 Tax=Compostimonas suwonensis TaxID=1048394 RepID=A0A2M9BVY0_9MICO|nr:DUF6177 family protein [Compostimonas suwonensis]PJJ62102.1 hypothetical protein CLV54_1895 [Compostimonas suwonensis]
MDEGLTVPTGERHPAVSEYGDGWVVVRSEAPIVHLTTWFADLWTRTAVTGARVILETPPTTVLGETVRATIDESRGVWLVRGRHGLYNGRTGRLVGSYPAALELGPPRNAFEISTDFLVGERPQVVQLITTASTRHRAGESVVLGRDLEHLAAAAGVVPVGWGPHEPAIAAWDPARLTEFARRRMPRQTTLVVEGSSSDPLAGTITARRTSNGVEEVTTLVTGAGPVGAQQTRDRVTGFAAALAELAATRLTLFAITLARQGRADLATSPVLQPPAEPIALLIGAPAVKQLQIDVGRLVERFGAIRTGRGRLPAVAVPLAARDVPEWTELGRVLEAVGFDRLTEATGIRWN